MGALVKKIDEHALQHPLVCEAGLLLSISKFPDWQWNIKKLPGLPPPSSPRQGAPRVRIRLSRQFLSDMVICDKAGSASPLLQREVGSMERLESDADRRADIAEGHDGKHKRRFEQA